MKYPKGLCQNPLITLIGWHIDRGTACGTCKQPFEIANHRVKKWVLKTEVNCSDLITSAALLDYIPDFD